MILKSFIVENDIKKILNYKIILLYGENSGLISEIKKKLIFASTSEVINIYQEDLNKNKELPYNEAQNDSLFSKDKIIIIHQSNDKILDFVKYQKDSNSKTKVILLSALLDKKSKLRNYSEKEKEIAVIPCYTDNEITLKKIISNELKDFKNLNSNVLNLIIRFSNGNRDMLNSNLLKIKTFFNNKIINFEHLEELLNTDRNEIFDLIRDAALIGDKNKLNELLNNYAFSKEESFAYLNIFNTRLLKLLGILNNNTTGESIEALVNKSKPPIFWKDKPIIINLLKRWDKTELRKAITYLGQIDKYCKTNTGVNTLILVQNSIINLCSRSWTYF